MQVLASEVQSLGAPRPRLHPTPPLALPNSFPSQEVEAMAAVGPSSAPSFALQVRARAVEPQAAPRARPSRGPGARASGLGRRPRRRAAPFCRPCVC